MADDVRECSSLRLGHLQWHCWVVLGAELRGLVWIKGENGRLGFKGFWGCLEGRSGGWVIRWVLVLRRSVRAPVFLVMEMEEGQLRVVLDNELVGLGFLYWDFWVVILGSISIGASVSPLLPEW